MSQTHGRERKIENKTIRTGNFAEPMKLFKDRQHLCPGFCGRNKHFHY